MRRPATMLLILVLGILMARAQSFVENISKITEIQQVERIPSTEYPEKYVMRFQHPLDYAHPEKGTFLQRVIVCHVGWDRPTVMVTEGYGASYALAEGANEEISKLLNANLVVAEYRYFQESMPQPCNWDYLTVWNSLNDLHQVNQALRSIYPKKWLATGISKGGQTTMFYQAYFPDDVDVSVPYVAPLNKAVEDGRHEPFLTKTVGNQAERDAILHFQQEILRRRSNMERLMEKFCRDHAYTFNPGVSISEVLDMCVLEYSYAMWQWGTDTHTIPSLDSRDEVLFEHLVKTSGPDYFRPDDYFLSFFVQAARELGYYGYETRQLRQLLSIKSTKNYMRRLMLPPQLDSIRFHKDLYRHTVKYLKSNDPKMIYIYGENDPWSSSGVHTWLDFSKKKQMHLFVDPAGSHRARISTLPPNQQKQCIDLLRKWMEVEDGSSVVTDETPLRIHPDNDGRMVMALNEMRWERERQYRDYALNADTLF